MASAIELEISKLLKNIGEPALVADELLKKWSRGELSDQDLAAVSHFLCTFGFYTALAENLAARVRERRLLPWGAITRLIEASNEKTTKDQFDQVFIGASEQGGLEQLVRTTKLDSMDPRFGKIRAEMLTERRMRFEQRRQQLIDKAILYKNDRRHDKEAETIELLLRLFPNDSLLNDMLGEIASRKAIDKISKKKTVFNDDLEQSEAALSKEETEARSLISEKLLDVASKNPKLAYPIAVSLYQMGIADAALKAIQIAPTDLSVDWFHIDILLETRRYLDALTSIDSLEKRYAADPEVTFASMYQRAKALWGLHQHKAAIEVMESLIRVKPDYRSAHSLLSKWRSSKQ